MKRCHKCGESLSYRNHLNLSEAKSKIAEFIDDHKNKSDDQTFINELRGEITHTSHHVWISNQSDGNESGHEIRQKVRRILWDYSKRKFRQDNSHINLDKYRPPHEEDGIIKKIMTRLFKK